jgi:hypothetical protein
LKKRKITGSTIDLKFINKLDTMTIKRAPRIARVGSLSAKSSNTFPIRKSEFNIEESYDSQVLDKKNDNLLTGISILNNSISGGHNNSTIVKTSSTDNFDPRNGKLFKTKDSIESIIKSLRRQKSNVEEGDSEYMRFLMPNIGIKLP